MLELVTVHYKKLHKIGMCTTFSVAQEIFFLKEGEKLLQHVTTSYNVSQEVTKTTQPKDWFDSCSKVLFFLKDEISCYNVLQEVTMRCNRLQNQRSPRTSLKVAQKFFFFLKEVMSCYNMLQQVTVRYKKLQKIGMCTTFNVAQEIFFLKEGEKVFTTRYNKL